MATYNLVPAADAYVNTQSPGGNYGNMNTLSIYDTSIKRRSFLRFSLASIPANAIITSAILQLYFTGPSTIDIYLRNIPVANRTWTETGITWNNQPAYESYPNIIINPNNTYSTYKSFDITSYVNDQHNLSVDANFILMSAETNSGKSVDFGSRNGSLGPKLTITTTTIAATSITTVPTTCTEICSTTVNVTWQNTGTISGIFTPSIVIDGIKRSLASESLGAGLTVTHSFLVTGLMRGTHSICPDPN